MSELGQQPSQGYESFDELVPSNTGGGKDPESFDDLNYDLQQSEEEGTGKEGDKAAERDEVSKDSPTNQLDEKEDTGDSESKKEVSKKDDKEVEKKDQKQEKQSSVPQKSEDKAPAPSGKSIRVFVDGKKYDIPESAKTKVKVANKGQMVSIADLKKDYSARTAWDKKFNDIEEREKSFNQKHSQYEKEKNYIISNIKKAREMASESLKDGSDPMKGINYLLDFMKIDSYDFNKGLMNHMAEQVRALDDMTESEREAYWLRRENEYIKSQKENLATQSQSSDQQRAQTERIDALREQKGVSKEGFASAYQQLKEMGEENPTPERVVRYAELEPFVDTASKLVEPYEDQMDDDKVADLIASIANSMADNREITEEEVKQELAEIFEVESLTDTINEKAEQGAPKSPNVGSSNDDTGFESFEDFDDY